MMPSWVSFVVTDCNDMSGFADFQRRLWNQYVMRNGSCHINNRPIHIHMSMHTYNLFCGLRKKDEEENKRGRERERERNLPLMYSQRKNLLQCQRFVLPVCNSCYWRVFVSLELAGLKPAVLVPSHLKDNESIASAEYTIGPHDLRF